VKTCAVRASVSASNAGTGDEEEIGGAEEDDPFASEVVIVPLNLAAGILHPIIASKAVGVGVGIVGDAAVGTEIVSD